MNSDAHPLSASLRGGESGANYEVLGKLATGGMAELFLARAPNSSGRPGPVVVLKRILPHLAEDPEFIRMFRDEAYLAATLRHPNIVQVFDIGKQGEDYFFTMEYVHGENLRAILRSAQKRGESIPLVHILTIALGITAALHHAHEQTDDQGRPLHIVHRDVSPTNVLVAYDGSVKIVDFGIAKAAAGTHVTQAGMLKGKASYMSPEQCRASTVDRRSDVFAIGILLYEMTTLTRLFKGENELAILHQVLSGAVDPPSSRRPGYPPELERIILKTLANDPSQRYATAEALQADLMAFGQQNGLRPSNPALGQFLRGLFGNKPLPWADHPAFAKQQTQGKPAASPPRPAPPSPPRPSATAQKKPASRPARGPGSRRPAPKPWRPGGGKPPPPPPPKASVPQPTNPEPTTAKQLKLGQKAQPHPGSRATAPRAAVAKPARPSSARPPARPSDPAARPSPQQRPPAAASAYAPPPPDYDLDGDESKTAIAAPKYDAMQEAKTKVAGTTADDVAAFMAAAPAAQLEVEEVKTQVAPQKTEDAVAAFLAAAPPADLVGDEPSARVAKTQVAPASAEEIRALTEAANKAVAEPKRDLFNAPAAPTRPGGAQQPQQPRGTGTVAPPDGGGPSNAPRPNLPSPSDLPPPGGGAASRPARPSVPSPSALPPPGGGQASPPRPGPHDLPPPGGDRAEPVNRRDTIMNAPAQPAALGGPSRTAPPIDANTDLDDLATIRMTLDEAMGRGDVPASPAASAPVNEHNSTQAMPRPSPAELGLPANPSSPPSANPGAPAPGQTMAMDRPSPQALAAGQPGPMGGAPRAPIQHWHNAPQGAEGGYTMPMPMAAEFDDEPIVVPGRNSKLIAMVITVVVGLSLGAAGVWLFLLD